MNKATTKRYFQFASEANRDAALRKQADEARALAHRVAMDRRTRSGFAWAIVAERGAMRKDGQRPVRAEIMRRIKEKCLEDTSMFRGSRLQEIAWQRLHYIDANP